MLIKGVVLLIEIFTHHKDGVWHREKTQHSGWAISF
tara:strand:+ start:144 stop:251 length:108 start_codon:yes stop_codon:yes gene_type:complete